MRTKNFNFGMPKRMQELWPWIIALDAWNYCDTEPLADLIISSNIIPTEIAPAIAEIITGARTQNKRGAAKLKINPARERMKIAGAVSTVLGLINVIKFDALDKDNQPTGAVGIADTKMLEPPEIMRDLEKEAIKVIKLAADEFQVSTETIENIIRDLRKKIKAWPSV